MFAGSTHGGPAGPEGKATWRGRVAPAPGVL
jgi:hypothetical protein